jgi:hypothetical protein
MLFDDDSKGLSLLEGFFGSPRFEDSQAWTTGLEVDDDDLVEAALDTSPGVQPLKSLSAVYRHWVARRFVQRLAQRSGLI